jgi:hypothetical protein
MAWTTPGTAVPGEVLTAAFLNTNLRDNTQYLYDELDTRGVLGYELLTTAFTTSSNHQTMQDEGLDASVTYAANRKLRITWFSRLNSPGGAQRMAFRFVRGSTTVYEGSSVPLETVAAYSSLFSYTFDGPATAGTETFKVQISAATNNTSVQSFASSGSPRYILIEDLGPA